MKQVNWKKILLPNLPYVFIALFCTKLGQAARLAPGEDLLLASRSGRPYGVKGTSFAAGFAAAHGAKLMMEDPSLTPAQLYEKLIEKARSCGGYLPWQ